MLDYKYGNFSLMCFLEGDQSKLMKNQREFYSNTFFNYS